MLEIISQVIIFICGVSAITLVSKKNKWGFVVGLASQPLWLITSYDNEQWGIFAMSIVYVFSWGLGIYEWFFKNQVVKEKNILNDNTKNEK